MEVGFAARKQCDDRLVGRTQPGPLLEELFVREDRGFGVCECGGVDTLYLIKHVALDKPFEEIRRAVRLLEYLLALLQGQPVAGQTVHELDGFIFDET
ncbi:hypothetical protein [Paraburkholderia sp. A3RO-2L]|jgi:hypothetical protein|uniref:hypothetical protein n=1 Tax=unclassified Paraburkholderia TaxID=2615204 RepID=UPI003DA8EEA8